MLPFIGFYFLGSPYILEVLVRKLITSFVAKILHSITVRHLLNLSTAISSCSSPCRFLLCSFLVEPICNSWPGSDSVFFLIFRSIFFGSYYSRLLPDARHAVQSLTLFSMSCFLAGHQNFLASEVILVIPE